MQPIICKDTKKNTSSTIYYKKTLFWSNIFSQESNQARHTIQTNVSKRSFIISLNDKGS